MRFKEKIKYAIFGIIPLVVLLAASEFAVRGYYYLKLGGYRYRIDRLVDLKSAGPYYSENITIANELGFSGRGKFDPKKTKNEYRILVLGGSGAAGTADCNWPDIMAEELNRKGLPKTVRVVNGGIGGHTSSEEKAWLYRWMKLSPDLIIIYDGWNDMYYSHYLPEEYKEQFDISNKNFHPGIGRRIEYFLSEHSIIVRKIKALSKKIKSALKNNPKSKIAQAGDDIMSKVVPTALNRAPDDKNVGRDDEFKYVPNRPFKIRLNWRRGSQVRTIDLGRPIQDNMSEIYAANIRDMVRLAAKRGVKVMLIVQPDLAYHFMEHPEVFKGEEGDMSTLLGHDGLKKDWMNNVKVLYPESIKIKQEIARDNKNVAGAYLIDDIFDGSSKKMDLWLKDSCHQTPAGMGAIGRHVSGLVYDDIFKNKDEYAHDIKG